MVLMMALVAWPEVADRVNSKVDGSCVGAGAAWERAKDLDRCRLRVLGVLLRYSLVMGLLASFQDGPDGCKGVMQME